MDFFLNGVASSVVEHPAVARTTRVRFPASPQPAFIVQRSGRRIVYPNTGVRIPVRAPFNGFSGGSVQPDFLTRVVAAEKPLRSCRPVVRTPGFRPGNLGSNPNRSTISGTEGARRRTPACRSSLRSRLSGDRRLEADALQTAWLRGRANTAATYGLGVSRSRRSRFFSSLAYRPQGPSAHPTWPLIAVRCDAPQSIRVVICG